MATLPNITIPANQWTDLYAATGITVGTQIFVENFSDIRTIHLNIGASQPDGNSGFGELHPNETKVSPADAEGAWAWCVAPVLVNVGEY